MRDVKNEESARTPYPDHRIETFDVDIEAVEQPSLIQQVLQGEDWTIYARAGAFAVALCAIGFSLFHLYTAGFGTLTSWLQRSLHLAGVLILVFTLRPARGRFHALLDGVPLIASLVLTFYMATDYVGIQMRAGQPGTADIIAGTALILLVLEASRRTNGLAVSLVAAVFALYVFFGAYLPGLLGHPGFRYRKLIDVMFNGTNGIFGTPIYISSTVLVLFVIFGAMLVKTGIGKAIINLAFALTGSRTGGPALTAVASSAVMGTVTGNGASNALITGSFTIPLMKRIGYRPAFAAAVEAVASQGGQIMPPIMGAAAFIMAEYTGIPYIQIAGHALIPAILYFVIAGTVVYLQAAREGLRGLPKSRLPRLGSVLRQNWYRFIPLLVIIIVLVRGYSPMRAGFIAVVTTLVIGLIPKDRLGVVDILAALEKGARDVLPVATACAAAGIIVGSVTLTGLGIRFSRLAIDLAGGNLVALLFMIMLASIILGMGMPTVSAYVILATLAVPALESSGVSTIAAHMFVFYFGIISGLTPPVAITAYVAAGIAGSDPIKTAVTATMVGLGGFILPYMFVFNDTLLGVGTAGELIVALVTALIGCTAFAMAIQGFTVVRTTLCERIALFALAFLLIDPGFATDIAGAVLLALVTLSQWRRVRTERVKAPAGSAALE